MTMDIMIIAIISIHALREEGDVNRITINNRIISISIHALREEGDVLPEPGKPK